ncbi:MAG: ABC transporter ATP-binding protein [Rickettsiaceae bacterium]
MYALEIENLHKTYSNGLEALKGISFTVRQGDFFGLLGLNGAGKSTSIGIITSLVNKNSGTVKIFGHDIDNDIASAKSCLGVVPQEFNFNQFETVFDIVLNQAGYYGVQRKIALERAEKYLLQLGLWDKRHSISKTLSGGMKRRLMIARALMHEPKMLILDEPTAGVDIELRRSMWDFLSKVNKEGLTIILTTHYLEEAEYLCKGIGIIDQGVLLKNTTLKDLLLGAQMEILILDLFQDITSADLPEIKDCILTKIDDSSIEIKIPKTKNIDDVFCELNKAGIHVSSLRNKSNRLEELFLSSVHKKTD